MRRLREFVWTRFYLTVREGPHYHPSAKGRPVVLVHRIGNIKRWTGALVAVAVLALLAATPAAAAKGCGQKIVDDWFEDGRVDKVYAIKCYRAALKLLPEDAQNYSSAPDEIKRALQDAIRQRQEEEAAKQAAAAEAEQQAAEAAAPATPPSEPAESEPKNDGNSEPKKPKPQNAEAEDASAAGGVGSDVEPPPPTPATEPTTGDVAGTTADESSAAETAEDTNGVVGEAIGKLGSGSADSVPVPLIIIGGLALTLLAAGGAALIARRLKARDQ